MKKKLLATTLALTVALSTYGTAFNSYAEEVWTVAAGDVSGGTSRDTQVTYSQASTFTVSIPKTVNLNATTKTAEYTINVNGDIASNQIVTVTPVDANADTADIIDFYMSEQSTAETKKADVLATVSQAETVWTAAETGALNGEGTAVVGTDKTGTISAQDLTSGAWAGTLTFDITLTDTP